MASKILQVRIDENLKSKVDGIFRNLGLNPSDAVRLFYNRAAVENGLPFKMRLPKDEIKTERFDPVVYLDSIEDD